MDKQEQCQARVWKGFDYKRCTRKAWNDGFCKQHHPDTVKVRKEKSYATWEEKRKREPLYLLGEAKRELATLRAELEVAKTKIIDLENRLNLKNQPDILAKDILGNPFWPEKEQGE